MSKQVKTEGFCVVDRSDCEHCPEVKEGHVYCKKEYVVVTTDTTASMCLDYELDLGY